MLLDDPLSALDAQVKKAVFEKVLMGVCKKRTRILVTHSMDFLHLFDKILIIDHGQITAFCTYDQLKDDNHLKKIVEEFSKNKV